MKLKKILSLALALLIAVSCISCGSNLENFPEIYDASNEAENPEPDIESTDALANADEIYKHIAFTFDDGPDERFTKRFVDKLAEYGGRATFFVVGNRITEETAGAMQYAVEKGNEIGIHAFTHQHTFDTCDDESYSRELKYTRNSIFSYVGVEPTLMRPPEGAISKERIISSNYPIILWSVDSEDWKHKSRGSEAEIGKNVEIIVENVLSNVKDGDIVLMHEIYENSYLAFSIIIDTLYNEGYRFLTVSELLGESIQSGTKYHSYTAN